MSREMKHSGIEWIGEIPKEWKVIRGKYLFNVLNGFAFDSSLFTNENTYTPLIRIRDISNYETEAYYMGDYSFDYVVKKGDVLVGMDGDFNVAKWKGRDAILNQRVCKLHSFTDNYLPQYAYYILPMLLKGKNDVTYATTVKHLSSNDIHNFSYLVPSLSEQQKIANYLDKVCGEVDEMIALQEQMIEELKAYKQSVITEAVTKGLNPDVPMKDSGIEWIGEVPEHWNLHQFRRIFEIKKIIAGALGYDVLSVTQNGIKVKDLTKNEGQIAQDYSKYQLVDVDDFVMNHMDLLTGFVDCSKRIGVTSPDYRVFKAIDKTQISLMYYLRIFQTCYKDKIFYHLGQGVSGMGRWRLPADQLKLFYLPMPPLSEQQSIASYLDTKCAEIDALIAIKQAKIEELKEYKKSVIYEYVTGKKEVV